MVETCTSSLPSRKAKSLTKPTTVVHTPSTTARVKTEPRALRSRATLARRSLTPCRLLASTPKLWPPLGGSPTPIIVAQVLTAPNEFRYGRVEIRARMPKGDWLRPAIWMLPQDDTYGPFPMSGGIDIVTSRGNGQEYPSG